MREPTDRSVPVEIPMSVTSENAAPRVDAAAAMALPRRSFSILSIIRLVLAGLATVVFLPYAWGFTLVVYAQWHQFDLRYVWQLVAAIAGILVLSYHLGLKLPSRRAAIGTLLGVFAIWAAVCAGMINHYNGDTLPTWLVFAAFFPATLWVVWAGWMFFVPMWWSVRLGVLAVFVAGVAPYLMYIEVGGLQG